MTNPGLHDQTLSHMAKPKTKPITKPTQTDKAGLGEGLFALSICRLEVEEYRNMNTESSFHSLHLPRGQGSWMPGWVKRRRQWQAMVPASEMLSWSLFSPTPHTMPSKPCRPHFLPATWQPNLSASCMLFPGGATRGRVSLVSGTVTGPALP